MKKLFASVVITVAGLVGLAHGQENAPTLTIHKEVESAFVFGQHADDVVYGTIVDPLNGHSIQEVLWRGIDLHHERGYTGAGLLHDSDMLEFFTIVNNTDNPVSIRYVGTIGENGSLSFHAKGRYEPITVQPHASSNLVIRLKIHGWENNGDRFRTCVRMAGRDFVFPGLL